MIAPALVPCKPGERIKTDRRHARKLAELHWAGLLTVVQAPTPAGRRYATCAEPATTRARTGNGAATASASSCLGGVCTTRAVRGPRRTGAGSMV